MPKNPRASSLLTTPYGVHCKAMHSISLLSCIRTWTCVGPLSAGRPRPDALGLFYFTLFFLLVFSSIFSLSNFMWLSVIVHVFPQASYSVAGRARDKRKKKKQRRGLAQRCGAAFSFSCERKSEGESDSVSAFTYFVHSWHCKCFSVLSVVLSSSSGQNKGNWENWDDRIS